MSSLYDDRKLSVGHPDLEKLALKTFSDTVRNRRGEEERVRKLLTYLGRLVDLEPPRRILVLGCGPMPLPMRVLDDLGHAVVGVEPVADFVAAARSFLGSPERVLKGAAEAIPLPDQSQDVVFLESVLEHVDSPLRSLAEIFRVLAPGGILYLSTTNRHRFSIAGRNSEFAKRFYNWYPPLLKECYVFQHLHFAPRLANYTERPAVHWYTFSELCRWGRLAGFAQFYSVLDLIRESDPTIARSWLRSLAVRRLRRSPWLRALLLTQVGKSIVMYRRVEAPEGAQRGTPDAKP